MEKKLKGSNVLITAGPVWVPIDKVRILTNIFGGKLGYVIAKKAQENGLNVTLIMGPGKIDLPDSKKNLKIINFKYYDQIYQILKKKISSKKFDIIIHSCAIPDYVPKAIFNGKIKSGKKELIIKLKPTIKIVDQIKKWDPDIFLVKFKLEVDKTKNKLINIAYKSLLESKAELIVANEFNDIKKNHKAYIIDKNKNIITCYNKIDIAKKLFNKIIKINTSKK